MILSNAWKSWNVTWNDENQGLKSLKSRSGNPSKNTYVQTKMANSKPKKPKLVSNQSSKCIRKYPSSFETSSKKGSIRCETLFRCEKRIQTKAQRTAQLATSMLVTDVGDEMCWRQLWDVGDVFGRFCHQHPLSFNISVGLPDSGTNIQKMSPISKFCH